MYDKHNAAILLSVLSIIVISAGLYGFLMNGTNAYNSVQVHKAPVYLFEGLNNTTATSMTTVTTTSSTSTNTSVLTSALTVNATTPTTTSLNATTTTVNATIPTTTSPTNNTVSNTTANNTTTSNTASSQTNSSSTTISSTSTSTSPTTTVSNQSQLTIQDPYAIINRSNVTTATVKKGQITTITIQNNGASGGTTPYTYQWLESYDGSALTPAMNCGAGNNPSIDSVTPCVVSVTPAMHLGKYLFKLEVTDASNTTIIDSSGGGFTLIITNLTLSTSIIINSGNSTATGTVTGGSGTYDITWAVNGTFVNGTATPCTYTVQDNGNTTGMSTLMLTDGATYTCSTGGSFKLTDGTYNIKFAAADAANLTDSNSSTGTLVVDWPSGIFSSTTINAGDSNTLIVAWQDTGYCGTNTGSPASKSSCSSTWHPYTFTVNLYKSSSTSSCQPTGSLLGTNSIYVPSYPSNIISGYSQYLNQTTFSVTPSSTTTYCADVLYYTGHYGSLVQTEATDSPATATITVVAKSLKVSLTPQTALISADINSPTFTASATGGTGSGYQYEWTLPTGLTAVNGCSSTYSLSATACKVSGLASTSPYTITVLAKDSGTNTISNSLTLTINQSLTTSLTANWIKISPGQSVSFTNVTSGGTGGRTYTYFVNGNPGSTSNYAINGNQITFYTAGAYVVSIGVKDQSGEISNSSVTITVTPPLEITLSANRTQVLVPPSGAVLFTNTTSGGTGGNVYSYTLNNNNGATINGNTITFSDAQAPYKYNVTIHVSDLTGERTNPRLLS